MPRRKSLRSQLYRGARDLGKRYVRRAAYRKTNSGLGGILRAFGLSGGAASRPQRYRWKA
jgi:hypothetical protein